MTKYYVYAAFDVGDDASNYWVLEVKCESALRAVDIIRGEELLPGEDSVLVGLEASPPKLLGIDEIVERPDGTIQTRSEGYGAEKFQAECFPYPLAARREGHSRRL